MVRRSWDHLIFRMEIPKLLKQYLYIESAPSYDQHIVTNFWKCHVCDSNKRLWLSAGASKVIEACWRWWSLEIYCVNWISKIHEVLCLLHSMHLTLTESVFNSSHPGQNGRHFADYTIFWMKMYSFQLKFHIYASLGLNELTLTESAFKTGY